MKYETRGAHAFIAHDAHELMHMANLKASTI